MIRRLLIANRGEIAIRIARTAAVLGIESVAAAPTDDVASLHACRAARLAMLPGAGPAAYLDQAAILAAAASHDCDAIHPGYGFLSEHADFARACRDAGIVFVGPDPNQLERLGDKAEARALAIAQGLPVLRGSDGACDLAAAQAFMVALDRPVMVKALAGGGGRGIRLVERPDDLPAAFERCRSEAERAFGDGRLYVEQALTAARHIEVQVVGDGQTCIHLGERDCTVQRRNQKLLEIAPSPHLPPALRGAMQDAAIRMATAIGYRGVGTFEFLVDLARKEFFFLEVNPRLQVEHTVTEEIWGVDLVAAQLGIVAGSSLAALGLTDRTPGPGFAIQARVNAERIDPDGHPLFDGGTLRAYEPPGGPGVRVDGAGYVGYALNPRYDSLLAKVIVRDGAPDFTATIRRLAHALGEFRIDGVATSIPLLQAMLAHPDFDSAQLTTRFLDAHLADLVTFDPHPDDGESAVAGDAVAITAPIAGVVIALDLAPGDTVRAGQAVAVTEAMKMEHVVAAPVGGTVTTVAARPGEAITAGALLLAIVPDGSVADAQGAAAVDPDHIRPDLAELVARRAEIADTGRPAATAHRHDRGHRTARENIADLCDADSFVEYGGLVVAAQRRRRTATELAARTPGDGVVTGFGLVNGDRFDPAAAQALVIAFDETVLAGTVGEMAREKMKHALSAAYAGRRPVVLFAEGGGGRAGDTDGRLDVTGWTMDVSTYHQFGRMSGLVPLVGITNGRCFAANAGMLACCDVIIATAGANIGVGGPSMIEGGRLGTFTPEQIGPAEVQTASGVIDVLVADEAAAVDVARRYLSYFQGPLADWSCADQRAARAVVPENRLRAYEVRRAIEIVADTGSVLELRPAFGEEIVTALIRVEGRPLGVVANSPLHLGGAIGSNGADKASRFMRLCEAFGLPVLMLCDTPGVMVGPDAETSGTVRKMGRMFVTGANLTVPVITVVLRKAYGIGAELMAGGWFKAPRALVSWPTGEFGGMNIEGNVKLAHSAELAAIADPDQRRARFDALVAEMHATGKAMSVATHFEIDDVIDPADTRRWITMAIMAHRPRTIGSDKAVPFVDPW